MHGIESEHFDEDEGAGSSMLCNVAGQREEEGSRLVPCSIGECSPCRAWARTDLSRTCQRAATNVELLARRYRVVRWWSGSF